MRRRPMSWRSASLRQQSLNQTWRRARLKRSPGFCQKNLEITIFWRRIANSLRNWPPDESSPQKSSSAQKKPAKAQPQTNSLSLVNGPASGDHRIRLVSIDAQVLDGFVEDGPLDLAVHEKLMQRGQRYKARVDFEEVAQRGAAFT